MPVRGVEQARKAGELMHAKTVVTAAIAVAALGAPGATATYDSDGVLQAHEGDRLVAEGKGKKTGLARQAL